MKLLKFLGIAFGLLMIIGIVKVALNDTKLSGRVTQTESVSPFKEAAVLEPGKKKELEILQTTSKA